MEINRKSPPPVKDFAHLTIPPLKRHRTDNGVELNMVNTGDSPANFFSLVWRYGSDNSFNPFVPTIVPNMMMQGTKNMSAEEIVDKIDFLGAFINNKAGSRYSSFDILSLDTMTSEVLDVLTEIFLNPVFPDDKFEAIKRKSLAQFDLLHSRTAFIARERLSVLLAGEKHPYFRKITRTDIECATNDDIKKAWSEGILESSKHVYASGLLTDTLKSKIHEFSEKLPQSSSAPEPIISGYLPEEPGLRVVEMKNASQASVALGIPTVPRTHPDYIPLRIATVALGGYFGSRLMSNIREKKGLTYGISASLSGTYEGASININADCDAHYVPKVLNEIEAEMNGMSLERMDLAEFRRLKSYYMTTIASTLESFKSIGEYYQGQLTVGLPNDYFEKQQVVLERITPEDICEMASKYFDYKSAISVVVTPKPNIPCLK